MSRPRSLWSFRALACIAAGAMPLVAGVTALAAESSGASVAGEIRWEAYVGEAIDGSPVRGELGRIRVPENRSRPDGRSLELAFVRYRTTNPDLGPPIVFLAGGPGGSGVEHGALMATHPQIRLLEHSDVIALDQRGTGLSGPNPDGPNLAEAEVVQKLPLDRAASRAETIVALEEAARRTAQHWRGKGVDLTAYTTVESADDLEALRRALGLGEIVLYAASYGSHLGLAYLRRHGEHVARAVLTKVEGPNDTWKLPSTVQGHLESLHRRIASEPALAERFPELREGGLLRTLEELLRRLEERPVRVIWSDEDSEGEEGEEPVVVGPLDLQVEVSRALAEARTVAKIPGMLSRFARGDWSELASTARDNRRVGVHAMALMMDCASGATAERRKRIQREARDPANLLGDAILAPFYPEACKAAGAPDLGDAFRSPFESAVPVLFVSGTLDVRTPPSNVEAILGGFARGVHVVVENAGHEARELMSPEYRDLLQAFLRGQEVASCRIRLPAPILDAAEGESATEND